MAKKIMLIDGNSILNRGFYGIPLLSDSKGRYTNGVFGFFQIVFKLLDEENPDYIAVAFDRREPTFRHTMFDGYKGTRKGMPGELVPQVPLLKEVLSAMGVTELSLAGYEADDILGTLSKMSLDHGLDTVLVSGDRDLLQLAGKTVKVRIPKTKGGQTQVADYYDKDVIAEYGVTPEEFIDVKALMGDTSDNIPGVPGIGEKTAVKIIQAFHSIENAIAHYEEIKPPRAGEKVFQNQEQARLSKTLATICREVPLEVSLDNMSAGEIFGEQAYDIFKELGFKSMFSRFEQKDTKVAQMETKPVKVMQSKAEIASLWANLAEETEVAYLLYQEDDDILGLGLSATKLGNVWIPVGKDLSVTDILEESKGFFQDAKWQRITYDVKTDVRLLKKYGITLSSVAFDAALAAYLLNPTRDTYHFDDIALEFLQQKVLSEEEVLGKGKSKKSLLSLPTEEVANYISVQTDILLQSKRVLAQQLTENGQEELYNQIELPLAFVLSDMEQTGIKINEEALLYYQEQLGNSISLLTQEIYHLAGEEFNINSPKQLGVILFEKLGLKGGKKTKTGYSTAADVLEKLLPEHPIIEKMLLYRQLAKLKSTYADGLLAVMDQETKKIYSTFNQTIAATGRISSTEPNLQNIPIRLDLGRELRKVFIPTDENYVFLDGDYSQIELRVLAHISKDETLINAFLHNQDIHRLTASQVFHVPFDQVTQKQRSDAKAVNFGIVYGIGAFSLSQDLQITRKEAEQYIKGYFEKYPNIKTYMDETIATATEKGYVSTLWGRRRPMPELKSSNFIQRSFGERVAMNMPIQGSAADIIKIAMVKVHNALKERNLRSRIILQVHDELLLEAHIDEVEEVTALLKDNMEQAVSLAVPMEVDVHKGHTWYETK